LNAEPLPKRSPLLRRRRRRSSHPFLLVGLVAGLTLSGCGAPAWKPPVTITDVDLLDRAQTRTAGDVEVTVAVPTREETELLFGTSLYREGIQPVWISIDNRSGDSYLLLKPGMDSSYFSPLEASYQRHSGSKRDRLEMDKFFHSMGFTNPVEAGTMTQGFVFTNLDEGAKAVNVDLVGNNEMLGFSFVIRVPGLVTDVAQIDVDALYDDWIDIDDDTELRKVLASFSCCTANKAGSAWGDPLNIVMIGDRRHIFSALIRRGWHQTEITYGASARKTVRSFLFGSRYRYSPISPLYVFGRSQDVGMQRARGTINLRNHMRLWRTQYNYRGKEIYVGQISRDIGVKFNKRTVTTHAIDPDVDETRDGLVADLAYSQSLRSVGYVKGSQVSTLQDTHYNLSPDPYYSDGLRAVMFFEERPTSLNEIEILDWEQTGALEPFMSERDEGTGMETTER
jgi:hypothetical protein